MSQLIVRSAFEVSKLLKELVRTSKRESLEKLGVAHNLFRNRAEWLPAEKRIEILKKTSILVRERREQLALQAAEEGGKPLADSLVEIDRAANGIEVAVQEIAQLRAKRSKWVSQQVVWTEWLFTRFTHEALYLPSAPSIILLT